MIYEVTCFKNKNGDLSGFFEAPSESRAIDLARYYFNHPKGLFMADRMSMDELELEDLEQVVKE